MDGVNRATPGPPGALRPADEPWTAPPARPALGVGDVHVWRATLGGGPARAATFERVLAPDELARAGRFYFQRDRDRFVIGRGLLRTILASYLGMEPDLLSFAYGPFGKPALDARCGGGWLSFNLSHSADVAVLAVARARQVGVDVERVRADFATDEIAERFFSRGEVSVLRGLPPETRADAFFRCWTRKEAFIKARGDGLSLPLDQFDVAFAPGEPAALLRTAWEASEALRWGLRELDPGPGFAAAVAAEGTEWYSTCWQWEGA
jgi:4'-phosphopantetheinyl transferase